jgi:hypothetical protein
MVCISSKTSKPILCAKVVNCLISALVSTAAISNIALAPIALASII